MRLCRARDAVFAGVIVARTRRRASVQTRQRGLEMGADGAIVYSVRSSPQLLVLPLQFSDQFLKLQHLQLCVGDFIVAKDVCHHLGAEHLCFHLVKSTLRWGQKARPALQRVLLNSERGFQIPPVLSYYAHSLADTHTDAAAAAAAARMIAQPSSHWSAAWSSTRITPLLRNYLFWMLYIGSSA